MYNKDDSTSIIKEENNVVIGEMITTENNYNNRLRDLGLALSMEINVGKDPLLLQLREAVFTLKGISDTLLLNAKVAYKPEITDLDTHRLLRIQRVSLLKEFFTQYKEYLKLFDTYLAAKKANPLHFKIIEGYCEKFFNSLEFEAHLIEPIQRGCRYGLLIKEALKTSEGLTQQNLKELDELQQLVKDCLHEVNSSANLTSFKKAYQFGDYFLKPLGRALFSWFPGSSSDSGQKATTVVEKTDVTDTTAPDDERVSPSFNSSSD